MALPVSFLLPGAGPGVWNSYIYRPEDSLLLSYCALRALSSLLCRIATSVLFSWPSPEDLFVSARIIEVLFTPLGDQTTQKFKTGKLLLKGFKDGLFYDVCFCHNLRNLCIGFRQDDMCDRILEFVPRAPEVRRNNRRRPTRLLWLYRRLHRPRGRVGETGERFRVLHVSKLDTSNVYRLCRKQNKIEILQICEKGCVSKNSIGSYKPASSAMVDRTSSSLATTLFVMILVLLGGAIIGLTVYAIKRVRLSR